MPVILFRLDGVPPDEAQEVRDLLSSNDIDCYETPGGRWGISVAAIWLRNEAQLRDARELIGRYQAERAFRMRDEYEAQKREGKLETLADRIRQRPLQFFIYVTVIVLVLYFSIKPFMTLG